MYILNLSISFLHMIFQEKLYLSPLAMSAARNLLSRHGGDTPLQKKKKPGIYLSSPIHARKTRSQNWFGWLIDWCVNPANVEVNSNAVYAFSTLMSSWVPFYLEFGLWIVVYIQSCSSCFRSACGWDITIHSRDSKKVSSTMIRTACSKDTLTRSQPYGHLLSRPRPHPALHSVIMKDMKAGWTAFTDTVYIENNHTLSHMYIDVSLDGVTWRRILSLSLLDSWAAIRVQRQGNEDI